MCNTTGVLTKEDKNYIETTIDKKLDQKLDEKLGEFAILMKQSFDKVFAILDTKADKKDVDERFDRLEYRMDTLEYKIVGGQSRRLEKVEDDVRIIKSKLKI